MQQSVLLYCPVTSCTFSWFGTFLVHFLSNRAPFFVSVIVEELAHHIHLLSIVTPRLRKIPAPF